MQVGHVGVCEGLLDGDTLPRIKHKHFLEKVNSVWILPIFKKFLEIGTLLLRQLLQKLSIVWILRHIYNFSGRCPDQLVYHVHHLLLARSRQEHLTSDKLRQDAAH